MKKYEKVHEVELILSTKKYVPSAIRSPNCDAPFQADKITPSYFEK